MAARRIDTSRAAAVAQGGEQYAAEVWSKLPRCPDCGRPMRPQSQPRSAFPATVVKAGTGYCSTHYSARFQKRSLPGERKIDLPPAPATERRAIADRWSANERSTALAICAVADGADSAFEVMSMLGLFEDVPQQIATDLIDPKGAASGRYW